MSAESKNTPKKPYVKPEVKLVKLRADEVLAGGCKAITGGVGLAGSCDPGASCYEPGS